MSPCHPEQSDKGHFPQLSRGGGLSPGAPGAKALTPQVFLVHIIVLPGSMPGCPIAGISLVCFYSKSLSHLLGLTQRCPLVAPTQHPHLAGSAHHPALVLQAPAAMRLSPHFCHAKVNSTAYDQTIVFSGAIYVVLVLQWAGPCASPSKLPSYLITEGIRVVKLDLPLINPHWLK